MAKIINGLSLPNIPWQDKPTGCRDAVWRYDKNPIIARDLIQSSNSIFNSAVVPFNGAFAGVFRCDDKARNMNIHRGFSVDGYDWELDNEVIEFESYNSYALQSEYKYDPRVVFIEDRYYITWCNGYHGPTIGMAYTYDFKKFYAMENAFLPFNRNGVLFPRKINDKYVMLSRPSDNGHTPFGDIFISQSPNLVYWGEHRHVMHTAGGWQATKIGAGPIPLETDEGWLMFYHGVLTSCNGFVYSFGAAILDINEPWVVKYRTLPYLMCPSTLYECVGDVPNVAFPCAALADADTGRIAFYYGAADTVTCLAFGYVDGIVDFVKKNSM